MIVSNICHFTSPFKNEKGPYIPTDCKNIEKIKGNVPSKRIFAKFSLALFVFKWHWNAQKNQKKGRKLNKPIQLKDGDQSLRLSWIIKVCLIQLTIRNIEVIKKG